MTAAYDEYDYPAYWEGRDYEHQSEVIALRAFLNKIHSIEKIIDIGAGFGRLTPYYAFRARKVIFTDPSSRNLGEAKTRLRDVDNIEFLKLGVEGFTKKFKRNSFDLAIMIRVIHHVEKPEAVFSIVQRILKVNGYFILEFPNKVHGKAVFARFLRGDFTFPIDIFSTDRRRKHAKPKSLPFYNFHPEAILALLKEHDFEVLEVRSVSNIRSNFFKKSLPISFVLSIEAILQKALHNVFFGPSIFILAKKRS